MHRFPHGGTRSLNIRKRCAAFAGALLCAASLLGSARAENATPPAIDIPLGPFSVDEQNPENSIPSPEMASKYPLEMGYLMMALTEHADAETQKGNHAQAARFFMALAKGVPERAIGFRKACESWIAAKDWDKAAEWCGAALGRPGMKVVDQVQYVHAMLERSGPLQGKQLEDVESVLKNMAEVSAQSAGAKKQLAALRCRLAVNQDDLAGLEKCVQSASAWPANDPQRFLFSTMLATKRGDWDKAESLVTEGEKAGLTPALVKAAREQIVARKQREASLARSRFMNTWGPVLGLALGLGLLALVYVRRRAKPGLA